MIAPILSKHHSNMTNLTQHPIKVEKRQMSYLGIYLGQRQKMKRFHIQSILITSSKEQTKKRKLKYIPCHYEN